MKPALVIGDVHGHVRWLWALLAAEQIIDPDTGIRLRDDVTVVQLGDLCDMRGRVGQIDNLACLRLADAACDVVLYGNHDRAAVDPLHQFAGFTAPNRSMTEALMVLAHRGVLRLAAAAHGYLLTHAGVHPRYADRLPDEPEQAAAVLCAAKPLRSGGGAAVAVIDAIAASRGGRWPAGGILWRDDTEPLSTRWPQVYGHSALEQVTFHHDRSLCIDVGPKKHGQLVGVWLPELRFVRVTMAADSALAVERSDDARCWTAAPEPSS